MATSAFAFLLLIPIHAVLCDASRSQNVNSYQVCGASHGGSASASGFKVIGGQEAVECQYPWVVMVIQTYPEKNRSCGGSIIDNRHILTAAHCVYSKYGDGLLASGRFEIRSGSIERDSGYIVREVEKVTPHKDYDLRWKHNDLAILRLKRAIKFDKCQSPICLTDDTSIKSGRRCRIIGWGKTHAILAHWADRLKWVEDPMLGSWQCRNFYGSSWDAGRVCGQKPAFCAGDSGGPYVCQGSDGRWYQHGIVSGYPFGPLPCTTHGLYTLVPHYKAWIDKTINNLQ